MGGGPCGLAGSGCGDIARCADACADAGGWAFRTCCSGDDDVLGEDGLERRAFQRGDAAEAKVLVAGGVVSAGGAVLDVARSVSRTAGCFRAATADRPGERAGDAAGAIVDSSTVWLEAGAERFAPPKPGRRAARPPSPGVVPPPATGEPLQTLAGAATAALATFPADDGLLEESWSRVRNTGAVLCLESTGGSRGLPLAGEAAGAPRGLHFELLDSSPWPTGTSADRVSDGAPSVSSRLVSNGDTHTESSAMLTEPSCSRKETELLAHPALCSSRCGEHPPRALRLHAFMAALPLPRPPQRRSRAEAALCISLPPARLGVAVCSTGVSWDATCDGSRPRGEAAPNAGW